MVQKAPQMRTFGGDFDKKGEKGDKEMLIMRFFALCRWIYIVQRFYLAARAAAGSYFFRGKKVTKMPLKGNPFDGFPFKIPSLNDQRWLPLETAERADSRIFSSLCSFSPVILLFSDNF